MGKTRLGKMTSGGVEDHEPIRRRLVKIPGGWYYTRLKGKSINKV